MFQKIQFSLNDLITEVQKAYKHRYYFAIKS